MAFMDTIKKMFARKEEGPYQPKREYVDRRHDNLQRQISFYQKKKEIPLMEAKIKAMEKEVYGNGMKTPANGNILKVPNYFKAKNDYKWKRGGMLR